MTSSAMVIRDTAYHLGDEAGVVRCLVSDVERLKASLPHPPDRLVVTTAAEIAFLLAPEGRALIAALRSAFPGTPIQLVGLACVGFYAAMLDVCSDPAARTLVVSFEAPSGLIQHILDAVGVGQGELGLKALPGIAWAYLERVATEDLVPGDLVLRSCEIMAQEKGILGTTRLAKRALERLGAIADVEPTRVVSFDIQSPWAKELLKAFQSWGRGALDPAGWLPSAETGNGHYLSLKPLIELARYAPVENGEGLLITTLGAGGRLGLLHAQRHGGEARPTEAPPPDARAFSWREPLADLRHAATRYEIYRDRRGLLSALRDRIQFVSKANRGIDNLCLKWELDDDA